MGKKKDGINRVSDKVLSILKCVGLIPKTELKTIFCPHVMGEKSLAQCISELREAGQLDVRRVPFGSGKPVEFVVFLRDRPLRRGGGQSKRRGSRSLGTRLVHCRMCGRLTKQRILGARPRFTLLKREAEQLDCPFVIIDFGYLCLNCGTVNEEHAVPFRDIDASNSESPE
nr:hypothetical protein [Candidatus Njordarchaeota archaeon]